METKICKTKRDRLEECLNNLTGMHSDNLEAAFGIGSYFHGSLDEQLNGNERTIDIITLVRDLDEFYRNHVFENSEFSNPAFKDRIKEINKKQVFYILQPTTNYRLTIIPTDKFIEWTSPGSEMGYFLRGRLQKPLEDLIIHPEIQKKVKQQLANIRKEAVDHTFRILHRPTTKEKFLEQLVKLSYISEGMRYYFEICIRKKHLDILRTQNQKLAAIYEPFIEEYAAQNRIRFNGGYYFPATTRKQAAKFRKQLSRLRAVYTRLLINLAQAQPEPKQFYIEKALRTLKFLKNPVGSRLVGLTYPLAEKYVRRNANKQVELI